MIQKIKKAQALTEMAIFGTLILLCFYYLLTYIQRMNETQYVTQEAFRNALERASDSSVGSVSYVNFSNKRQANLYSPVVGERSQISGSGQIYWGTPPITYTDEGAVETGELAAHAYYKFNKDERELSGILAGEESPAVELSSGSLNVLVNRLGSSLQGTINAYAGEDETVLGDTSITGVSSSVGSSHLEDVVNTTLQQNNENNEDASENEIEIDSYVKVNASTQINYNNSNITTNQSGKVEDKVIYTINDKDGNPLYSIDQGLGQDGYYSHTDVDKEVDNVMLPGDSPRQWIAVK